MRKFISYFLLPVLLMLINSTLYAQDKTGVDETMRSNGKIYVVVAVCVTIMVGLFIYVWSVDRKVSRLEKGGDK